MNYIYDVLLNFNEKFYDFYEWNTNDRIIHIRKIPTFKIQTNQLYEIKNNIIQINKQFLKNINNKTEKFNNGGILKIKYTALFSDGKDVLAVKFNKNGINYMKSDLAIDEQDEIIDIIKFQKEITLEYKTIKKQNNKFFKTRFEIENENYILNELSKIYNKKEIEKLNYIYLECFGKIEPNINKALNKIKKEIIKGNDNFYKIFNIFKINNQK